MRYGQRLSNILKLGRTAFSAEWPVRYHDGVLVYDEAMVPVGELPRSLLSGLTQEQRIACVIGAEELGKLTAAERELVGTGGTIWPLDFAEDEDGASPGQA